MSPIPIVTANAAGFTFTATTQIIKSLYGVVTDLNGFLNDHINDMKHSDNPTIARTGRVLAGAKQGFGIGFVTPVAIIAVGQLLLGNPLSAVAEVATAATLTNPIAMTCAALGAIYYGWNALSKQEQQEMLDKLSEGLEIGVELIKAMISFVINKMKEWFSSENINEMKKYVASAAEVFGKTLGDVTRKVTDVVGDSLGLLKKRVGETIDKSTEIASDVSDTVKGSSSDIYVSVSEGASEVYNSVKNTASTTFKKLSKGDENKEYSSTDLDDESSRNEK